MPIKKIEIGGDVGQWAVIIREQHGLAVHSPDRESYAGRLGVEKVDGVRLAEVIVPDELGLFVHTGIEEVVVLQIALSVNKEDRGKHVHQYLGDKALSRSSFRPLPLDEIAFHGVDIII